MTKREIDESIATLLRVLIQEPNDEANHAGLRRAAEDAVELIDALEERIRELKAENFQLRHLLPPTTWRHPDGCSMCGTGKGTRLHSVTCRDRLCPSRPSEPDA